MLAIADAKFAGAVLGVSLGCIIGMTPLAFMGQGFFQKPAPTETQRATAAPPPSQ